MRLTAAVLLAGSLAFAQGGAEQVTFFEETQVTALLKKGDAAASAKDWGGALDAWQKIVDQHPDAVLEDSRNLWLPAVAVCRRRIAALPPEGVAVYVDMYQRAAAALAQQGGDEALRKTALRYFCTPAGADAMERLGVAYAESGALENAARCWEEIYLRHPNRTPRPAMLARLALLYRRLGDTRALEGLLKAHGSLPVRARGGDTTVAALLKEEATTGPKPRDPFSVNSDLSLTPLSEAAPVPRSVKWRLKLTPGKGGEQPGPRGRRWIGPDEGGVQNLQTYPHVAGDRLIVNIGRGLLCLDAPTGDTRWMSPGVTLQNAYKNVSAEFWMHRYYATVADGVVYWNQYLSDKRCRLAASCLADGKSFWDPPSGDVGDFDLTGPPLAWQNRIYVGAVGKDRPNDTWLLAFDRRSGALLWKRFLVGFEATGNPWGGEQAMPSFSPVVAAGGSYLFVCSNNGAFLCVDHQGELVWGTKYPGKLVQEMFAWFRQQTGETWDLNPVLFHGGDVIFFASDGTHCCRVDGVTGRGWKGSADPFEAMKVVARERCKHLVAMEGDRATLIGQECKIYDVTRAAMARKADGKASFDELPQTLLYAGRGLATRDAVYVPTQKRLLVYDRKFENKRTHEWPAGVRPGTLFIAQGVLLSVTPSEIVAFSEEEPKAPEEKDGDEDEDGEEDTDHNEEADGEAPEMIEPEDAPEEPE